MIAVYRLECKGNFKNLHLVPSAKHGLEYNFMKTPNIVILLADDMGCGDPGCYNPESKVPTPNIDRLAREGMRFTNAYCPDAICTPTRYALLTGRYSWRSGRVHGGMFNWEPPMIAAEQLTMPEMLRRAGYVTGGFGKWHLGAEFPTVDGNAPIGQFAQRHPNDGGNLDFKTPLRQGPMDRGFDEWYGFICSSESLVYDGPFPAATIDVYPHPKAAGVEDLKHFELADYLPEVTSRAADFVQRHQKNDQPFFLYFSPYVPHVPLAVPEEFKGRTHGGPYGDYVAALDHYLGKLLKVLDQSAGETLLVLASDNGSQFFETGENHRPNGTLNGRKGMVLEGGVRTPMIVRWPGRIAPGTSSDQLCGLLDLFGTFARVAGQPLPTDAAEDSFDLLPVLTGAPAMQPARDSLVVKAATAHLGLRFGPWKYIAEPGFALSGADPAGSPPQLFHLASDPGESADVLSANAEIAENLRAQLLDIVVKPRSTARLSPS